MRTVLILAIATAALLPAGATPNPATVYAWFKADSHTVLNEQGAVTNWQNQATSGSYSNRNLDRFGGAPRLAPATTPGGARNLLRLTGNDNLYGIPANFGTLSATRTIAAYLRLNATASGFLFDGSSNVGMTRAQLRNDMWQAGVQSPPIANGANADPVTLPATLGAWQLHFFSFEPVSSGTRVRHAIWGGASVTYTNSRTDPLAGLIIGENVTQSYGLTADVAEVLVYDRLPSPAEQQDLADYLAAKWGIPVVQSSEPDPASVYAWYRGDNGLNTAAESSAVTNWLNLGMAAATNTSQQALRNLNRLTGSPQRLRVTLNQGAQAAAIAFHGADGIWSPKTDFGILSGDRTLSAVLRVRDGVSQGFLFDATSYTPGLTRAQVVSNYWHLDTAGGTNNAYGPAIGAPTAGVTTNVWQVHTFIVRTNAAARFEHYIDGTAVGTVSLATPGALSGLMLGANASQQLGIRADVAEVLVFASALAAPARQAVESYLSNKWSGAVADTNTPPPPPPTRVPVFVNGQNGYACYRIPAMVTTTQGTVIAMADGRIANCDDIPNPLDLVVRRSFDNGRTWGPLQIIAAYGSDTSSGDVDTYPYFNITNPVQRVAAGDAALLVDRVNGRIWTLYDNGAYVAGQAYNRVIKLEMRYSDDDGATWSPRIDIEAQNPGLRPTGSQFLTGPGNGIQLQSGPHAGRLIFPVYVYGGPNYSSLIYSDDHGQTWRLGGNAGTGGGEVQMAETPNGGLLASMRNASFSESGKRYFSRSSDGGLSWSAPFTNTTNPPYILDPTCQGSILRLTTTNDSNASRLVHANAAHASSRVNMTLRISYDEGNTWPVSNQVYSGSSAYSALAPLASGEVGLLFEIDNYARIDFARRSVSQITGGADSLPPYAVWAADQFSPAQLANPAISGPSADPDRDGATNQQEFGAGTNPLDPASVLKLNIAPSGERQARVVFPAVSNRSYTLQSTSNLSLGAWQPFLDVPARPSNSVVVLPLTATNPSLFFRLATPQSL